MNSGMLFGKLLLIYQMPKTGSQTVEATLQQCGLPHRIIRLHFLSSHFAQPIVEKLRDRDVPQEWKRKAREQLDFTRRICRIVRARRILRACGLNIPKVQVITSLREPFSLALSTIFENFSYFFPRTSTPSREDYLEILQRPKLHDFCQHWFDWELRPFIGIDVFQTPFPTETGYAIYENGFARVLLYRYEALEQLSAMLRQFLGCEVTAVQMRNVAGSKPYSAVYHDVQQSLRLPPDLVSTQYNSRTMGHFYSEAERHRLLLRWTEPGGGNQPASPADRVVSSVDSLPQV